MEEGKQWVTFFKVYNNQNDKHVKHTGQKGVFPHSSKSMGYPVRYKRTFSSYFTENSVFPSERSAG
jgi:hypothetical protein